MIATPTIKPLKTSHSEADRKPANTTAGGAIEKSIARQKKASAVTCSGRMPVAQQVMTNPDRTAGRRTAAVRPVGGAITQRTMTAPRPTLTSQSVHGDGPPPAGPSGVRFSLATKVCLLTAALGVAPPFASLRLLGCRCLPGE